MRCTETQQTFQRQIPNISGLNTQFCRSYRHVYELADRGRMPNIVDMSHGASIIDTCQAIDLPLLLEDQTLTFETSILITNQYLFRTLIHSLHLSWSHLALDSRNCPLQCQRGPQVEF